MKRVLSVCLLIFSMSCLFAVSEQDNGKNLFFNGSVGTGTVIYGDSGINEYIKEIQSDGYSRILLTADAAFCLAADDHIRFSLGASTACDFFTKSGGAYSNFIDYAFFSGIRFYPGLQGLNLAVEYAVGRRTDFISADENSIGNLLAPSSTFWGNGFRFLLEYDFRHNEAGFAPVIGGSWRHMPRGDSNDDILSLYFRFSFR